MLVELRLENYAVIDNVAVEFAHGLNLLTGETGAGKSILIDALALLLGDKASTDVIRSGADRAVISHGSGMIKFPLPTHGITKSSHRRGNPSSSDRSISTNPAAPETRNQEPPGPCRAPRRRVARGCF